MDNSIFIVHPDEAPRISNYYDEQIIPVGASSLQDIFNCRGKVLLRYESSIFGSSSRAFHHIEDVRHLSLRRLFPQVYHFINVLQVIVGVLF